MSIKILHQIVNYDKSAQAWGLYRLDQIFQMKLIRHFDTQANAILAALPQILRDWVANVPGDPGRLTRACCIAVDRQAIKRNGHPGQMTVHSQNGNGSYTVNTTDSHCTCPDWCPDRQCKHVLAIAARDVLDTVTISLTLNQTVTGGRTRNIMIHDSKIVAVQEANEPPHKPRNPDFHSALRWLMEHNYVQQQSHWLDDYTGCPSRREKRIYVQMEATR